MKKIRDSKINISVIIVTYNEQSHIINCIKSILSQFNSNDSWELLIIDGYSKDATLSISKEFLQKTGVNFKIFSNPKKILSAGWNLGLIHASGEFVIRPDAHSELCPGYIEKGVSILNQNPEITAVGGLLETKANGFWGNLIKDALSSKVGVGNSSFRTGSYNGFVDTVVYGIYRKKIFQQVGYFNEDLVRHQDNEMHKRIAGSNGCFYFCSEMKAVYYCRNNLESLCKQMFSIGYYLPQTGFKFFNARHLAPFLFLLTLISTSILSFIIPLTNYIFLFVIIIYFSIILSEFIRRAITYRNVMLVLNIITVPLMHFMYGMGTLCGFISTLISGRKKNR